MSENIPHLPVGTIIGNGKYKIIRFIAAGGFGCTYEAEFLMMRTRVAIKEFFINSMCNRLASGAISIGAISQNKLLQHLEEKFVREAQNLFGLSHPNIIGVKDVFKELGTSYYVMDYVDGQSLQSIIDERGPLPEHQVMKYMTQVMDALEYVHNQKMLHLDLKPDNIMIDKSDRAILIDFGVSKQYDEVDGHNTSTILGQTPGFAPIEQMSNNISNFAPSTDIYALGATMYSALSGCLPPSAANLLSGMDTLQPLPQPTSMQARRAIEMMMRTRSIDRPQSIAQVRTLLTGQPYRQQQAPNHAYGYQQPYQPQPYQPQPYQPRPYGQNRPIRYRSGKGFKITKNIMLVLAILFTIPVLYYLISTFAYHIDSYSGYYWSDTWYCDPLESICEDYYDDYVTSCLTIAFFFGLFMVPCWILFGVFSKKYRNIQKSNA